MVVKEKLSTSHTVSFPEKVIAFYLKKAGLKVEEDVLLANKIIAMADFCTTKSLDIYFEAKNKKFVVEYDGYYYHKNTTNVDRVKNQILKKNGINIIRIRENGLKQLDNISYDYILKKNKSFEELVNAIMFIQDILSRIFCIKVKIDIDIKRDLSEIYALMHWDKVYNSISNVRPDIAKEWNYERNPMLPSQVEFKSHFIVWWKCEKGHEWQSRPLNRSNGNKCPICGNRVLLKGYNDFKTLYPELLKYWYPENDIKPDEILGKSDKEVLWRCPKCGDVFSNKVYKFIIKKTKCSHCKDKGL
jgi:very-short-patch-repair endonuclease